MVMTEDFSYTQEEKREAIKDEEWQELRLALKGTRTHEKLDKLRIYYEQCVENGEQDKRKGMIIIDNYLKALARGGQLYAGVDVIWAISLNFKLEIKRD